MKSSLLNIIKRLYLIILLVSAYSCDEGDVTEAPREIEFLSRVSVDRAVVNQDVTFTDLSLGAISRAWSFENADPVSSTDPEVTVKFLEEGIKNCSLVVTFFDGSQKTENFSLEILPALIANFANFDVEVNQPSQFTDISEGGPDQFYWEFPGGTPATSTERNPIVTWSSEQEVIVSLTVTRSGDGISARVEKPISVGPPNLFSREIHGFENQGAAALWQTWDGGGPWPANSLTVVSGGANGSSNTARVSYDGAGYWGMITRDSREYNAQISKGKTYRLSFYIRAQSPTTIPFVRFSNMIPAWWSDEQKNGDPVQDFYSQGIYNVEVTTEWQKYEAEFNLSDLPYDIGLNTFVDIELQGGVSPNVIFVDEISLKQLD